MKLLLSFVCLAAHFSGMNLFAMAEPDCDLAVSDSEIEDWSSSSDEEDISSFSNSEKVFSSVAREEDSSELSGKRTIATLKNATMTTVSEALVDGVQALSLPTHWHISQIHASYLLAFGYNSWDFEAENMLDTYTIGGTTRYAPPLRFAELINMLLPHDARHSAEAVTKDSMLPEELFNYVKESVDSGAPITFYVAEKIGEQKKLSLLTVFGYRKTASQTNYLILKGRTFKTKPYEVTEKQLFAAIDLTTWLVELRELTDDIRWRAPWSLLLPGALEFVEQTRAFNLIRFKPHSTNQPIIPSFPTRLFMCALQ